MTPHRFNPVMWAFALVVVLIFGAVAYRVVVACEPSSFELLKQLKVALGGCSPPSVGKTEPRSSVPPVASSPATLDPKRENRSEPAQTPGPKSRLPAGTDTKKLPAGDSSTADSAVVTPSVKSPETGKMDHGGVVQSPDSPKIEAPKGDAVPPQQPTTTNQSSKQERLAEWRALRNTAMKVFQPSDRDPRLVKIVQAATRDYEYRFAMEIARDIYYATTRDKALWYVGCHALYISNDRASAEAAAAQMHYHSERDRMYQQILEKSVNKNETRDAACKDL